MDASKDKKVWVAIILTIILGVALTTVSGISLANKAHIESVQEVTKHETIHK